MESFVLHEITPLMDTDAIYIVDRRKREFSYPVHNQSLRIKGNRRNYRERNYLK